MINPKRHVWVTVMSVAASNKLLNWSSLTKPTFVSHSCNSSLRMVLIHRQLLSPKGLLLLLDWWLPQPLPPLGSVNKGREERKHTFVSHILSLQCCILPPLLREQKLVIQSPWKARMLWCDSGGSCTVSPSRQPFSMVLYQTTAQEPQSWNLGILVSFCRT